ncbi:hypothetical protein Trydic_g684 [Trypoxylus dichotomus]
MFQNFTATCTGVGYHLSQQGHNDFLKVFDPPDFIDMVKTEAEKERTTTPGRMATRTAPKTTPDMEKTFTSTATEKTTDARAWNFQEVGEGGAPSPKTWRSPRCHSPVAGSPAAGERNDDVGRGLGRLFHHREHVDGGIRDGYRRLLTSVRQTRKRSGTKPGTAGESQPIQSVPNHPKAKDARVPPVVLREKARWMAVNAELSQQPPRPHTSGNSKRSRTGHWVGPSTHPGTPPSKKTPEWSH